jgi:hypothetical protein
MQTLNHSKRFVTVLPRNTSWDLIVTDSGNTQESQVKLIPLLLEPRANYLEDSVLWLHRPMLLCASCTRQNISLVAELHASTSTSGDSHQHLIGEGNTGNSSARVSHSQAAHGGGKLVDEFRSNVPRQTKLECVCFFSHETSKCIASLWRKGANVSEGRKRLMESNSSFRKHFRVSDLVTWDGYHETPLNGLLCPLNFHLEKTASDMYI